MEAESRAEGGGAAGGESNELRAEREQRNKLAFYNARACTKILSLHLSEARQSERHTDN